MPLERVETQTVNGANIVVNYYCNEPQSEFGGATAQGASGDSEPYREVYVYVDAANGQPTAVSPKSKYVAFALCFFLGFFGAHRFYLGKYGSAILYLFTAGVLCIGWIVDIVRILTGSMTDADGLPLA
ncbi:MAG: TM2 domain-containing protein [Eggerthellaceae bacterium]|nr:TM2 domain-containing protein [Eggerthellaceae bacterium]